MIKNKKILILLYALIFFVVALLVIAFIIKIETSIQFRLNYVEYKPDNQPNTTWISEDEKIKIVVAEEFEAKIYFEEIQTQNEFDFSCGIPETAYISVIVEDAVDSEFNLGKLYETWKFIEVNEDSFTVVVQETEFLKIGNKIKVIGDDEEISYYLRVTNGLSTQRFAFGTRLRRFRLKTCHRHVFKSPKPSRVRSRLDI